MMLLSASFVIAHTCDSGHYASALSCRSCPKSYYQDQAGESSCIECKAGYFENREAAKFRCKSCLAQTATNCGKGQHCGPSGDKCSMCPIGQAGVMKNSCMVCIEGQYQPTPGQTSCFKCASGSGCNHGKGTQCPTGYYQNEIGKKQCKLCPKGKFQPQLSQVECAICPAGKFGHDGSAKTPQHVQFPSVCLACPASYYQEHEGSWGCVKCKEGQFTHQASSIPW